MSKNLLFRADDLGYSEAVNFGIAKTLESGLVKSLGVMINMPATQHGLSLVKNFDIALGLHTNICAGRPLTDSALIPSLVDEHGYFKSSKLYRTSQEDFLDLDQAILEIEAQLSRFRDLTGKDPDYFEGHAVASRQFFKALEIVASKNQLKYSGMALEQEPIQVGASLVVFYMESMAANYDPFKMIAKMAASDQEAIPVGIFHPGYLDQEILINSTLTLPRPLEVAVLTDPKTKNWLDARQIKLIDYREL